MGSGPILDKGHLVASAGARLHRPDVVRCSLSSAAIPRNLERQLHAFGHRIDTATVRGPDMQKYVGASVIWCNKSEALLLIEPLNFTCRQFSPRIVRPVELKKMPYLPAIIGPLPQPGAGKSETSRRAARC